MITLTDGTNTVTLPDGTTWVEEFTYTPVVQAAERSLGGALIIDLQQQTGGQPITLQSTDPDSGWLDKVDVDRIVSWSRTLGQELTLNLRGTTFTVLFRHHEVPAFAAEPVTPYDDPESTDPYTYTLRLVDVTP